MSEDLSNTLQLLRRWHAGDEACLDALLRRHLPWIREQVKRRLGPVLRSKGETGDYVQDVVVEFLRHGARFTVADENHFRALLYRVVDFALSNKLDWFTARRRAIARERPLPSTTILALEPAGHSDRTPSKSVERRDREGWIRLGIEFLAPPDREVLVLRQWESLSMNEVAERLGIEAGAAQMRYVRALRRLAAKIGQLRRGEFGETLQER
jgi:RNA polymerase sigma-70 factor (ECF subfamily)